jgi:hypothetical protein
MTRIDRTVSVGWEYEVPVEEVQSARDFEREGLELYFGAPVETLSDKDVAQYLVRTAHPTTRYLRDGVSLGYKVRTA